MHEAREALRPVHERELAVGCVRGREARRRAADGAVMHMPLRYMRTPSPRDQSTCRGGVYRMDV